MVSWFGIRDIGSIIYLLLAIGHGVQGQLTAPLVALTLLTVATSIVVHGVSALPLMDKYLRR